MTQPDGGLIEAVAVSQPFGGDFLTVFEVVLRRIEAEGEIGVGDAHLRLETQRRIGNGLGHFPERFHLVELVGHIDLASGDIAVQFGKQLARGPVQNGRTATSAGERQGGQRQQYEDSGSSHTVKLQNFLILSSLSKS